VCFQVRAARLAARGDGLGDLDLVVLVVAGDPAQVWVRDAGKAGCLADRQLIISATKGKDLLR